MNQNVFYVAIASPFSLRRITLCMHVCISQGCQMVSFQTKNPNLDKFWRALHRWEMLIYFKGHLEYFKDIWDILWPFGTFCAHLVHFSGFGIKYLEKSGNPGIYLQPAFFHNKEWVNCFLDDLSESYDPGWQVRATFTSKRRIISQGIGWTTQPWTSSSLFQRFFMIKIKTRHGELLYIGVYLQTNVKIVHLGRLIIYIIFQKMCTWI
jgi:hypothetical protein